METYEPRQVREEAAISSHLRVPRGNPASCYTRVLLQEGGKAAAKPLFFI